MTARVTGTELHGIAGAEGRASGEVWLYPDARHGEGDAQRSPDEDQRARYRTAQEQVREQLLRLEQQFGDEQREVGEIFAAQALMLADPSLEACIYELMDDDASAEEAVRRCGERFASQLERTSNAVIRERASDCREVTDRLLGALTHETAVRARTDIAGKIVVAAELPPGEAVSLVRAGAGGLVLEHGGTTSHTAIVARALGVPAVLGVAEATHSLQAGQQVTIDGDLGQVTIGGAEATPSGRHSVAAAPPLSPVRDSTCTTHDGVSIQLAANVELPEELDLVRANSAAGIGLYRSEFLLIETEPDLPDEELQIQRFSELLDAANGDDVVLRTYDLGGRKLARETLATQESHPSLGLRGIRILDLRRHLFHTQARAALRTVADSTDARGRLRLLLPMVTGSEEVNSFREFLRETADELGIDPEVMPPVGAMVETPAAALTTEALGRVADFLAIGTNDLVQYTLAAERDNEHVAHLYQPLHPSVLRLIRVAVEGAQRSGTPISVCGELAASPLGQIVLIGLGVERLSMHPVKIEPARRLIRNLDSRKLRSAADAWTSLGTADAVIDELRQVMTEATEAEVAREVG